MELIYVLMEDSGHESNVVSAVNNLERILEKKRKYIDEAQKEAEYMNWSTAINDCDNTWITVFKDGEEITSFMFDYDENKFVVDSASAMGNRDAEIENYVLKLLNHTSN